MTKEAKTEEKQESAFQSWKSYYDTYIAAQQQAKQLFSEDDDAGLNAQNFSIAAARAAGLDPDNAADPNNLTHVRNGLKFAKAKFGDMARGPFLAKLEEIVKELPVESIIARLPEYVPAQIEGDDDHNKRVVAHQNYRKAVDLVTKMAEASDFKTVADGRKKIVESYVKKTTDKVAKVLADDKTLQDSTRKIGVAFAATVYGRKEYTELELQALQSNYLADAQEAFVSLFKDDEEKGKYARHNLYTQVKALIGDGKNNKKIEEATNLVYTSAMPLKKAA